MKFLVNNACPNVGQKGAMHVLRIKLTYYSNGIWFRATIDLPPI